MKKKTIVIAIACTAFAMTACQDNRGCTYNADEHSLTCPEKTYATLDIGGNVWMAENLVVYSPDSSICYDNNHDNCVSMGRLYTWEVASGSVCPTGWRLPTQQEFKDAFGTADVGSLKKADVFNMQFAGFKYYDGKFADRGASASFWTAEAYDDSRAYLVRVTDSSVAYEHFNKNIFASVRCVKE
ncbi:FISUMP domain-containing protein [uncultured Fibrobacter sp.]|uniref:FISUMP domain-containing protein n=1 Tax=uncultured Fibrobacter sp. TaxID=261512 RepID=UPI0026014817|nr:FISUMP domain-containing protein [uncultured Fibrobacter sp.]MBR3670155.1 hypothetical protein [Fibrobacter sp.]